MSDDPRQRLIADGVAASTLEGVVAAESYRRPTPMAARRVAGIRERPEPTAMQRDQLLFGEAFAVLETARGWAFGQAARDGYVGWVEREALAPAGPAPTHRVAAIRSRAYAEPSARAVGVSPLSLNALVHVEGAAAGFARVAGLGWIPERHLAPIGGFETDPAGVAARFLGAPYLWGGRDLDGVDCSGLMLQALFACGRGCPRDSDQQAQLGRAADPVALRRGDLVCWSGHIGMMLDEARLVHASGFAMAVVVESLAEAIAARRASAGEPTAYRRL